MLMAGGGEVDGVRLMSADRDLRAQYERLGRGV